MKKCLRRKSNKHGKVMKKRKIWPPIDFVCAFITFCRTYPWVSLSTTVIVGLRVKTWEVLKIFGTAWRLEKALAVGPYDEFLRRWAGGTTVKVAGLKELNLARKLGKLMYFSKTEETGQK